MEVEVTVETKSPWSLLMERDMMGWCMWTPRPPVTFHLSTRGPGSKQGCPHSNASVMFLKPLSLFLSLFNSVFRSSRLDRVRWHLFLVAWDDNRVTFLSNGSVKHAAWPCGGHAHPLQFQRGPPISATLFSIFQLLCFWVLSLCCLYLVYLFLTAFSTTTSCIFNMHFWVISHGCPDWPMLSLSSWHHQSASHGGMRLSELHVIDWPASK